MKKVLVVIVPAVALVAAVFLYFAGQTELPPPESPVEGQAGPLPAAAAETAPGATTRTPDEAPAETDEAPAEERTEEEKREAEIEKAVDAFDEETDRWMDAEKTSLPTMAQVDHFRDLFRKLPKDRKDECLHRALNLIPDENVMLLVGILMDKTEEKELVELVYNDILNRDEDVKKPILQQIFKDKSHPCWTDTAWILDVTGEK